MTITELQRKLATQIVYHLRLDGVDVGDAQAMNVAAHQVTTALVALVPRCPACGRMLNAPQGMCGECATQGVEVAR